MRPRIICHMVSSIDGRLLVERWTAPAGKADADGVLAHYEAIAKRLDADGWMVGRTTMAYYANGAARAPQKIHDDLRRPYVAEGRAGHGLAVAVDRHGKLHYGRDAVHGDHFVAILGESVSDDYLAELREDGVSYLFAGPDGNDLKRAMDTLGDTFGTKTLLLEGGGLINGAFLKAGLIDEISLLVYPGIDGLAGVPSIFEYAGAPGEKPAEGQSLKHFHTETLEDGMVWLRYHIVRDDASV